MDQEIRFGGGPPAEVAAGAGIPDLPKTQAEFEQRYGERLARRPQWLQVLEAASLQLRATPEGKETYGDPVRGATLPQAWRMQFAIFGHFRVCLLASGRPATPTAGIEQVVLTAPNDLVRALARGSGEVDEFTAQLFVHDGRMGHSISLQGHDPATATFLYHDPWPERSLLCREYNAAGVDAQPAEDGLWRLTEAELAKVIFAAFVMPTDWADLAGNPCRLAYTALQASDFWTFFHLKEASRDEGTPTRTSVALRPGGFASDIDLGLELDRKDQVRGASLKLRRGWMLGPPHGVNPFAADIAQSFIGAFLPAPDRPVGKAYVEALSSLRSMDTVKGLAARTQQGGESEWSPAEVLQLVYLGIRNEQSLLMTYSRLDANVVERSGEPWLSLSFDLY